MKQVLMFSYFYPPCNEPGSRRPGCMAKYLPEFGWAARVVTRRWTPQSCSYDPDCVRRLPSEALLAAIDVWRLPREAMLAAMDDPSLTGGVLGFLQRDNYQQVLRPQTHPVRWTRNVIRTLPALLGGHDIRAVWATYKPTANLYLAERFARELGVPWVADFRDVPGQAGVPETFRHRLMMQRTVTAHGRLLGTAAAITTVSQGLADILRERYGREARVIMNGFDPEDMADGGEVTRTKFTLVYTGCIYPGRSPQAFLDALASLIEDGRIAADDVGVDFYTDDLALKRQGHETVLLSLLREYRHPEIVEMHEWVSGEECNRVCQSSAVLLLPAESGTGILTSKLFAYLAAERPILAGPAVSGGVADVLAETGAGVACGSPEAIAERLLAWYREWKSTGTVRYGGDRGAILKYSRKGQAGQLAEVLDAVSAGQG